MRKIDAFLLEYGESHKNATNKTIHWIFVPLIIFSFVGMLWVIPVPEAFSEVSPYLNWASIGMSLALIFYIRLSLPLFFGFAVVAALMLLGNSLLFNALGQHWMYHLGVSFGIFLVSWIGQFIGHEIEGKKPSFFKDLQFFLIGPAWLLHFIYKKVGIPY